MATLPWRARQFAMSALCLGLLVPTRARGQSADPQTILAAQALYDQATKEMDANSYASACPKIEEVTRLLPESLGAKHELAVCYEALDKLASAWSHYTLVEQLAAKAGETDRSKKAGASAAALRPKLATLVIEVPDDVLSIAGLVIMRDRVLLGEPQWGTPLPADVGEHEVAVTAPGREPWIKKVEVGANWMKASLTVKPPAMISVAEPKAIPPTQARLSVLKRPWQRPLGIAAMGIGGASVATGAMLGGLAIMRYGDGNEDGHCDPQDRCDEIGLDLRRQAFSLGNGSTAAITVGVAALAGGVVLFATAPSWGKAQEPAGARERGIRLGVELTSGLVRVKGEW